MPVQENSKIIHAVAHAGYAARGVIYLIIGGMAGLAAFGPGGATTGSRGALGELLGAPFGKTMLAIMALGLLCYATWRALQAIMDADGHGTGAKGLAIRGGLAVSAITHTGLAFFAGSLLFGWGAGSGTGGSGDGSGQDWTAWLLSQPFGPWLVAGVGVVIAGAGVAHFFKAWTAGFEKYFVMSERERAVISPICRFGLAARGLVFLIIGGFLIVAAIQHDSSEARGLSGVLQTLQQQSFGNVLLAILAFGLLAFAAYSLIEARYRKVSVDS